MGLMRTSRTKTLRTNPLKRTTLASHAKQGFTLLELLVSLVIISLMTAAVGFSISSSSPRTLKAEGEKLAARLNAAQAQLAAGASSLRLIATPDGYAFEQMQRASDGAANTQWQKITADEVLAQRTLPAGSSLVLYKPLQISREPVATPTQLRLVQDVHTVTLSTAGTQGWQLE